MLLIKVQCGNDLKDEDGLALLQSVGANHHIMLDTRKGLCSELYQSVIGFAGRSAV